MSRRRPRQPTLVEIATANLCSQGEPQLKAIVKAAKACATVWALAVAAEAIGHWPKQAEYARYWGIDERTAGREWALFRRAFPTETSPERLARLLRAEVTGRLDRRSGGAALALPAPLELIPVAG